MLGIVLISTVFTEGHLGRNHNEWRTAVGDQDKEKCSFVAVDGRTGP